MSGELSFEEVPYLTSQCIRCFALRQTGRTPDVYLDYLEFYPDDSLWCLVRYTTTLGTTAYSAVHAISTLMEIEGAINDPPIDLALATLALMGY